jgi:flagellar biosynthesis anti-sigma factor FlgM
MKIDGNKPAQDAQSTDATRRATGTHVAVRQGAHVGPTTASSDRVELSADAALLTAALQAARDVPAIRTGVVDQAREKLLTGRLGTDSLHLADAILDDLLK